MLQDVRLLCQEQRTVYCSYYKISQIISIFVVSLSLIPHWLMQRSQLTQAYIVDCVTGRNTHFRKPKSFIRGRKQVYFYLPRFKQTFCSAGRLSLYCKAVHYINMCEKIAKNNGQSVPLLIRCDKTREI